MCFSADVYIFLIFVEFIFEMSKIYLIIDAVNSKQILILY